MKNFYIKLFCLLSLLTPFFANAYDFTNNLKIGDSNIDVLELQKILNADPETVVSLVGSGSKGNETNYFGGLTKQAVMRFQEKYGAEILLPNGLSVGTGFVGASTRQKLNKIDLNQGFTKKEGENVNDLVKTTQIANQNTFNEQNPEEKNKTNRYFGGVFNSVPNQQISTLKSTLSGEILNLFPSFSKDVRVFNAEPYQVKPGNKIVINGTGFSENNNVFLLGETKIEAVGCQYSTYCEVFVPNTISLGEKIINITNNIGNSYGQGFKAKILVTNEPMMPTVLNAITPNKIKQDNLETEIILNGDRFSKDENYVYTPLGNVGPYRSDDGKTLIFSLKNMKDINKVIERGRLLKADNIPLPVRVDNQYGSSGVVFISLLTSK